MGVCLRGGLEGMGLLCLCLFLFQLNLAVRSQWVYWQQQLFSSTVTALAQLCHRHLSKGGVAWLAMLMLAAVLVATA